MPEKKKRGPGRPPRAGKTALDRFELRLTGDERTRWERAARMADLSLAEWLRALADKAAR